MGRNSSKFLKTLVIVLVLVAVLGLSAWKIREYSQEVPYTIWVDGDPVVTVRNKGVAMSVLRVVRSDAADSFPLSCVRFTRPVKVRIASKGVAVSNPSDAVRTLKKAVGTEVWAFAVFVDDKPVVALKTSEDAERALDLLKRYYATKVEKLSGEPVFKEKVTIHRCYVTPDCLAPSAEKAAEILRTPAGEREYYTVRVGDRAVNIAPQFGLTLAQLKELNPGVDLDRLRDGDRLLVRVPVPPVTVVTKRLVTRVVDITGPAEPRYRTRTGKRHTTAVVIYENDTPVEEQIISQVTVWNKPEVNQRASRSRRHVVEEKTE